MITTPIKKSERKRVKKESSQKSAELPSESESKEPAKKIIIKEELK
jgi:predicted RNA-binding protein Jag